MSELRSVTKPKFGRKRCAQCAYENSSGAGKCASCGAAFPPRQARHKSAVVHKLETPVEHKLENKPAFAVGPTTDGGLLLTWPRDDEFILLTADEAEHLIGVLLGQSRVARYLAKFDET